ncbi:MAG: class B sortase [Mogibacterium sp.]|nr:class B sortase [Mogibacterium sp.]
MDNNTNNKKTRRKKSKARRIAEDIIVFCLAAIVLFSGWKVYSIYHSYKMDADIYKKIADVAMPDEMGFNGEIDFDALREINPDIVGWIYYEGTKINYPIVQGDDNDYYLHVAFENTWAAAGSIFVDAITEEPFKQFNTIVYGHHMKDGTMFGDLGKLRDKEFLKEHPQFELITPEGKFHLRICAFLNQPADSQIYTTNFHEEEGKQSYINLIKGMAEYITTEEMTTDSRLVILSTCAYEYQDARYMVVGKMIPWE